MQPGWKLLNYGLLKKQKVTMAGDQDFAEVLQEATLMVEGKEEKGQVEYTKWGGRAFLMGWRVEKKWKIYQPILKRPCSAKNSKKEGHGMEWEVVNAKKHFYRRKNKKWGLWYGNNWGYHRSPFYLL